MEYEKTLPQVEEKTLKTKSHNAPVEKSYLVAMSGPQAGTVFTLTQGVMVAGRIPQVEMCLPDTQVSRKHAQFSSNLGETKVQDLDSTNGTFVNGKRLEKEKEQLISDGDEIQIGDTVFRFSIHNPIDETNLD
ncbi:MAG: FHA domain-containing protein [Bdellovibrionota bacterium]